MRLVTMKSRRCFRALLGFSLGVAVAMLPREGAGSPPGGGASSRSGLEVGAVGTMLHDGYHAFGGGGLFVEFHLIPHRLHLELAGLFGGAGDAGVSIFEALLKYPYALTRRIELFGGAGLTVPFVAEAGGTEARPGLTLTAGSFYWFRPPVGLVVAGVFNVLSSHDGAHLEGGLTAGIALQL